jgi:DNA-binding PadR family transcriptional regulator
VRPWGRKRRQLIVRVLTEQGPLTGHDLAQAVAYRQGRRRSSLVALYPALLRLESEHLVDRQEFEGRVHWRETGQSL